MGEKERRRYPRVPLNLLIQFRFDSIEDFLSEYATDVSEGGMFIRSQESREVGAMIYLQFSLKDGTKLIEGLGRVVRVISEGERRGMGVEFVNFDEASRELIEKIVADRAKS